jgi:hypothetical protein
MQRITVGRTVLYTLTAKDVEQIIRRRTTGSSIKDRMTVNTWPKGAQAHIGNEPKAGYVFPMVVVRITLLQDGNDPSKLVPIVNGQVLLDGNDVLWVQKTVEGSEPGQWAWPTRS